MIQKITAKRLLLQNELPTRAHPSGEQQMRSSSPKGGSAKNNGGALPVCPQIRRIEDKQIRMSAGDTMNEVNGGARRDRTDDLMLAKHALSQLSYGPMFG